MPVTVEVDHHLAVLTVHGRLDDATGQHLLQAAATVTDGGIRRLDLDLQHVESFSEAGAAALAACRDVAGGLDEGLHYRTGRGAGKDALLAAYAEEP